MLINPFAMNNPDSKFWKIVFLFAGLFTAGGVMPSIITPAKGVANLMGEATTDAAAIYLAQTLWLTVLVFGIGYFIVATRPSRYLGIVILGFLGKLFFVIGVFANGTLSSLANLAASIDVVFIILFGIFILKTRK